MREVRSVFGKPSLAVNDVNVIGDTMDRTQRKPHRSLDLPRRLGTLTA